jgi:hypothetical protein
MSAHGQPVNNSTLLSLRARLHPAYCFARDSPFTHRHIDSHCYMSLTTSATLITQAVRVYVDIQYGHTGHVLIEVLAVLGM